MGFGDELMGTGMAKRIFDTTGKRTAFGNGKRILWHHLTARDIYRGNSKILGLNDEKRIDPSTFVWVPHYPGHRLYHAGSEGRSWIFNRDFRAEPGELFFKEIELALARTLGSGFIVVEPNVKRVSENKRWPTDRFQLVVDELLRQGHDVVQFDTNRDLLRGVRPVRTKNFRYAAATLKQAALFIGPEGGLHHACAADPVNTRAVVIFGGFTHPRNTGYDTHENLFIGDEPCGRLANCSHCTEAMQAITVDMVLKSSDKLLQEVKHNAEKNCRDLVTG